jgi:glycosyltransferase involved in cell wall biosynthesis
LVRELVRSGIEVTLFHRDREPLHKPHVADLKCKVVGLSDRGGLYWEQIAVPLALWRGKYDLFHAPAEHGVPLAAPCPVVLTYHSVTLHSYADLIRRGFLPGRVRDYLGYDGRPQRRSPAGLYHQAQVARADHVIVPSEFCRREVIRFLRVPPGRVTVTPLAVHDQFRRPPSSPEAQQTTLASLGIHQPYLLYVGGYEPHKNVQGLLKAFAGVKQALPQFSLVLVGSKSIPEYLYVRSADLGLLPGRDVCFLLNLTEELTDVYDGAELFISLSWRETFCLPALEAFTRGVPVVASAWGATSEVVGDVARLVDPRDHPGVIEAVLELASAKKAAGFGLRARQAASRFDWSQTARQTRCLYQRLAG